MSRKFCAVILNYRVWEETIECVNSLLEMNYDNFEAVIVDNGSGNGSAEELEKRYQGNPLIHILSLERNLGFAKGNNAGIYYAREKLGADFVFVCNSDIVMPDSLFAQVDKEYEDNVGVISPSIYRPDGSFQMPNENFDIVGKRIRYLITHLLVAIFNRFVLRKKSHTEDKKREPVPEPCEWKKYMLQGCAYFLTPDFFKHYKGLYPKTFLYWEEIDLLYFIHKSGLKSVALKTQPVIHKDKGTTARQTDDLVKFKLVNSFKSMLNSIPLFCMSYKTISKKF